MRRALVFYLVQAPVAVLLTAAYSLAACLAALGDRSGRRTQSLSLVPLLGWAIWLGGQEPGEAA